MSRAVHMRIDVRGVLRMSNARIRRELGGCVTSNGRVLTNPREIRDLFMDLLAAGNDFVPMGDCDNFDPEAGCRGHESGDAAGRA